MLALNSLTESISFSGHNYIVILDGETYFNIPGDRVMKCQSLRTWADVARRLGGNAIRSVQARTPWLLGCWLLHGLE